MSDRAAGSAHERAACRGRAIVLIVLLASFAVLKLVQTPPRGYYGADGATYFGVARHVAEGDGLLTSVSLYHQGLKHLPAPTTIYPLWPLVLGLVGRVVGLERAARTLPELLYLIDLALLYALANRLASAWGPGEPRLCARLPLDLGHVAVLLFGLNPIFVRYSSLPYTEPLALCLTLAALLLLARHADTGRLRTALLSGACAGAAYLARTSMIAVPLAVVATLLLVGWRERAGQRAAAVAALGGALVVLPWLLFLRSFLGELRLMMLVDVFTVRHETRELAPLAWIVPVASLGDLRRFVGQGLLAAFRYGGPSYARSFGIVTYTVPLAIVCVLASSRLRAGLLRGAGRTILLGSALCGLGLAVMAHAAHSESDFARLWAFDHRHGLPFILLIVGALACLLHLARMADASAAARAALRAVVLLLSVASIATSARHAYGEVFHPRGRSPTAAELELADWLAAQSGTPMVIASRAPRLAVTSRAGFQWIDCNDEPEHVRRLFRYVGADYVAVRRSDRRCRFMQGLEPELELVERFPGRPPLELFRWRAGVR